MKVYGIRIFVDDLAAAREFYGSKLGLPVKWDMADHGAVGYDMGVDLIVERTDADGEDGALVGRFVGVSIQVDDIDEVFETLKDRGVSFDSPPERQFWGGVLAHFRDPAGNVLTLLGAPKA